MSEAILDVRGLVTEIRTRHGVVRAVDDVSLTVGRGEIVALVGESGSGKSMTAYSLMQLFPTPSARVAAGQILFEGRDLLTTPPDELRRIRGDRMAMIFQDPSSFLNPLMTVGRQVAEPLLARDYPSNQIDARVHDLLTRMGLPDAASLARRYPFELSGGQRQRALIAAALACKPMLVIADEPTTALDVTVQAQIMDLLHSLRDELGLSILLITHDLGIVAQHADRVYVMYAARLAETATTRDLFHDPRHPYTRGLLRSTLSIESASNELYSIPGVVPNLAAPPQGCRFHPRCPLATETCHQQPPLAPAGASLVACWYSDQVA